MTKPYAMMTDPEKWQWHSDVYAFRRVVLSVPAEVQISPCDETGKWFDEGLVRASAARLVDKRNRGAAGKRAKDDDDQREGRAIINAWAQRKGYADIDAYADSKGIRWLDAYAEYASEPLGIKRMPREPAGRWTGTAADLGVTAKEFAPSPEEMAASRRHLGIDQPLDAPAGAAS